MLLSGNEQWRALFYEDLGTMDERGYVRIVGRLKDVIMRGGENVYPAEIEYFLHTHPKIQDAQIISVPDERLGEEVCAWIKLRAGETMSAGEVKDFCKDQVTYNIFQSWLGN